MKIIRRFPLTCCVILLCFVSAAAALYIHDLNRETRETMELAIAGDEFKEQMREMDQMTTAQLAASIKIQEREIRNLERAQKKAWAK